MSQSPDEGRQLDEDDPYLTSITALNLMMAEGRSFSGHERNCCFLNTGGERFADVSSATGLDFVDDGRAVALTDWDHDGDLDMWIANRTAPSVRFMRNDMNTANHFVAFKLVGKTCNRDAIGARVQLELDEAGGPPRVKTVEAGHGFLTQSSKWLHFGLGDAQSIRRLTVRWPGGQEEVIEPPKIDGR